MNLCQMKFTIKKYIIPHRLKQKSGDELERACGAENYFSSNSQSIQST